MNVCDRIYNVCRCLVDTTKMVITFVCVYTCIFYYFNIIIKLMVVLLKLNSNLDVYIRTVNICKSFLMISFSSIDFSSSSKASVHWLSYSSHIFSATLTGLFWSLRYFEFLLLSSTNMSLILLPQHMMKARRQQHNFT